MNTYLNVLKYAGSSVDQDLLYLTYGGFLVEAGEKQEYRVGKEASMAYSLGLYLESFYHDDPQLFIDNVKKNIKMRLAPPIVFVNGEFLNDLNQLVPVVCCGYSDECLLVINPKTSEEMCITIEDCIKTNNQWRMIMLNVPGMSRMKDVSTKFSVQSAVSYYLKRFNASMNTQNKKLEQEQILTSLYLEQGYLQQLGWLKIAKYYQEFLNNETEELLKAATTYYENIVMTKGESVV